MFIFSPFLIRAIYILGNKCIFCYKFDVDDGLKVHVLGVRSEAGDGQGVCNSKVYHIMYLYANFQSFLTTLEEDIGEYFEISRFSGFFPTV